MKRNFLSVVRLLLALAFCSLAPASWAQTVEEVDAKVQQFMEVTVRGLNKEDPAELCSLIQDDAIASKLVFIRCLVLASQSPPGDETGGAHWVLAKILAEGIESLLKDPTPNRILAEMGDNRRELPPSLDSYLASVTSPTQLVRTYQDCLRAAPGRYNKDSEPSLPLNIKTIRFNLARIAKSPALLVQELDTYPLAFALIEQRARAAGMSEADIENIFHGLTTKMALGVMQSARRAVELEFGLIEDDGTLGEGAAEYPLTGFRASFKAGRQDRAAQFLEVSQKHIALTEGDPVFRYVAATNAYQLRRLRGEQPTPAQVVREFQKAWSELDGYQPFEDVLFDMAWDEGRLATRYWLAELARHPDVSRPAAKALLQRLLQWNEARGQMAGRIFANTMGDLLTLPILLNGFMTAAFGVIDQITTVVELFPDLLPELGFQNIDLIHDVRKMVNATLTAPETLTLLRGGPAFPDTFDLGVEGLMPELLGRAALIESREGKLDKEKRLTLLAEAVKGIRRSGTADTVAEYLLEIGQDYQKLGDAATAMALWREAQSLSERIGAVATSIQASALLADELARQGNWADAARYSDKAGSQSQETQALVDPQGAEAVAELSFEAHIRANQPAEALAAITRGKSVQTASVRLAGDEAAKSAVKAVGDTQRELAILDNQVEQLKTMPASATRNDLLQKTQQLLAGTRADFLAKSREIRKQYATLYSSVLKFDPLDLSTVQKGLGEDVAVVQYFATDEALYIFVVTRDAFRLRSLKTSIREIDQQVGAFARALRRNQVGDQALANSNQWLYTTLVEPVGPDIVGKSTLVLIPSGRLNILPFAALTGPDGKSLLDTARILELAKATDLTGMLTTQQPVPRKVVAFANATGDLPAADKEGQEIAALFPSSKIFRGKEATRQNFLAHGAEGDILHLATHGEWNVDDSLQNYLSMAGTEKVAQQEIFELALDDTSLVILSACNTAMGDGASDVRFVASLAEAFWIAGSPSVVASLWAVNDESTALLMEEFYRGLKAGVPKAEALRKAQLAVRSNPRYAHPYYWAGFVLFGQWR